MNEQEQNLEQIELSIDAANKNIDMYRTMERLHNNADFKKLIVEGFFKEEASRVVALKADPNIQGENEQKQIDNIIISIGGLRQYFNTIYQLGKMSERAVKEDAQTREEILQEQLVGSGENAIDIGNMQ